MKRLAVKLKENFGSAGRILNCNRGLKCFLSFVLESVLKIGHLGVLVQLILI